MISRNSVNPRIAPPDSYINSRLNAWAVWRNKITSGGLGFPSQAAFAAMRYNKSKGSVSLYDNNDTEETEVDVIVNYLINHKRQWGRIIQEEYCTERKTVTDKARYINISRKEYYTELKLAKTYIEGRLGV